MRQLLWADPQNTYPDMLKDHLLQIVEIVEILVFRCSDSQVGLERFAKLSFDCAETKKLSNLRVNDGFLRETIETIGGSGHKCY